MLSCIKDLLCKKKPIYIPDDKDRLREFFIFCESLEEHPFVVAHKNGGTLSLNTNFPEDGEDTAAVNFDEIHLESLLTRLRQFLYDYELFFVKDLRRSTLQVFGAHSEFEKFYSKLMTALNRKYPKGVVQVFVNGKDVIADRTYKNLLEDRLYTGAIHSERRLSAKQGSVQAGMANAHIAASKHMTLTLASSSMRIVQNVFSFRRWILKVAEDQNKTTLFSELEDFKKRVDQSNTTFV